MNDLKLEDWGRLLLRLSIGGLMLFHGFDKLAGGVDGIAGLLQSKGLPGFLAWGVVVGEVIAPVMIIAGFYAFNMLVAVVLAHASDVLRIGEHGEWAIELQMLYLLGGFSITLLGAGKLSLATLVDRNKRST